MSIESIFIRSSAQAAKYLGATIKETWKTRRLKDKIEHPVAQQTIAEFLERLNPANADELHRFLESAQFEFLANQVLLWQATGWDNDRHTNLLHEIRSSLSRVTSLDSGDVRIGGDIILQFLTVVIVGTMQRFDAARQPQAASAATAMACHQLRNNEFVAHLRGLSIIHQYSMQLRRQVRELRSILRLTHLATGPITSYGSLHVEPAFAQNADPTRSFRIRELLAVHRRLVVLGDPGAGKSTFAAKLAFDLATDNVPGLTDKVPFLLVARDHAHLLQGGHTLNEFLDATSRNPYNVTPPEHGLEYLLKSGSAVVIIDGVDELGTREARCRFGELVEAFSNRYPDTRMVVTSRIIGYDEAPLDPRSFPRALVRPFTGEQCKQYAVKWFALDNDSTPAQRERLAHGLMAETETVDDLRRNPLLLSLLCSLYASKHYIPRHRTEIYEQCAELLFERWDKRRDISVPLKYVVDVRPAITELAWKLFADPSKGQKMRKREILGFLTKYLREERYATDHEAAAAAEDFLAFCAGRAWVLTETGTDSQGPLYGFTHSTFLEYFAALHLVRKQETVEATWQALRPRIGDASWSVVSELAVQILDRNSDGGANRFVAHLVRDDNKATDAVRLCFAARLTSHLTLNNASLQDLCLRAINRSCAVPADSRRLFLPHGPRSEIRFIDQPLSDLLLVSLPENASRVASFVIDALLSRSAAFADVGWAKNTPAFLLAFLRNFSRNDNEMTEHIAARMHDLELPSEAHRWEAMLDPRPEHLREHGIRILYQETLVGQVGLASKTQLLLTLALTNDRGDAHDGWLLSRLSELYDIMISQPWPWLTAPESRLHGFAAMREEIALLAPQVSTTRFMRLSQLHRSAAVLLLLPYTQLFASGQTVSPSNIVNLLSLARHQPNRINHATRVVEQWCLEPHALDLLTKYLHGEASPIG
ncbi:NACHT domain-containing protein [Micromonospora sp. NPDC047134]|uniref:NACHT domain-containing protein n=1 Tax=Micromonospora sp. NPDC047134 TaxID=3154340 RepID=UPI0033C9A5C1